MERLYGDLGEQFLRDAIAGASRQTFQRAIGDLLDERDDLRELLRLFAHRVPWDGEGALCWCHVAPRDTGSPKDWRHDVRCREVTELLE